MYPIVSLLLFISLLQSPQDDELSRIITAQQQQDFVGIWVREFHHGDTTLAVERRIWHRHPEQSRIEFIAPEKLRGSALFIDGESVRFAGNRHVRHFGRTARGEAPTFAEALRHAAELDWIRSNYTIEASGNKMLLNRPTIPLRFVPKNPHRGHLEIWADRDTGILLYTRRFDRFDRLVSASFFREIEFAPVDPAMVALPDSLKHVEPNQVEVDNFTDLSAFIAGAGDALLLPREPPAGFHFRQVKAIHRKGKIYYHFQYSDGLTTLSLFEFSGAYNQREQKSKRDRKPNSEALSLVRGEKAGVSYSLLGEVAVEELEKMAASLVLVRKDYAANNSAQFQNWLIIIGAILLLGAWLWSRHQRSAKLME